MNYSVNKLLETEMHKLNKLLPIIESLGSIKLESPWFKPQLCLEFTRWPWGGYFC